MVDRWNLTEDGLELDADGDYYYYEDYESLKAEKVELIELTDEILSASGLYHHPQYESFVTRLNKLKEK